ncbi:hypothetical protein C943_01162 [Mariniradius saccharolyticus AK6]|uniref:Uncharacterized protein n=1 Tax=Mariniradius saccharolyticus AK6 TaxID=1239962 RepID=M7X4S4_9BACT|nr:hypothetical protein C943_01162 [Mariniradius saccharolyticus AK6]
MKSPILIEGYYFETIQKSGFLISKREKHDSKNLTFGTNSQFKSLTLQSASRLVAGHSEFFRNWKEESPGNIERHTS